MASLLRIAHGAGGLLLLIFTLTGLRAATAAVTHITDDAGLLGCYTSMFNFGDSVTDTGNYLYLMGADKTNIGHLPYGETFFHHPTGRCTDGRVVIDFMADALGLPFLPPYLRARDQKRDLSRGVNFAVAGATTIGHDFFFDNGVLLTHGFNVSIGDQIDWFKEFLPSLCHGKTDCQNVLSKSLVIVSTQYNDYLKWLLGGKNMTETEAILPLVINATVSSIETLIELGVTRLIVTGSAPLGCMTMVVAWPWHVNGITEHDQIGCVWPLNQLSKKHNHELQKELKEIKKRQPYVHIIYADYYNNALRLYRLYLNFGFTKGPFLACCGSGGSPYNFDEKDRCEDGKVKDCIDPENYLSWDGMHFTEKAYKIIADGFLHGPYLIPSIDKACALVSLASG